MESLFKDRVCKARGWSEKNFEDRALWASLRPHGKLLAALVWPLRRRIFTEEYEMISAASGVTSARQLADVVNTWRTHRRPRISRRRLLALDPAMEHARKTEIPA